VRLFGPAGRDQAEIDAPPSPRLWIYRLCFVAFFFSFVFDYKAQDIGFGAAETGGSLFQYAFLALAVAAGGLGTALGIHHLLIRPGVCLVLLWWGYVGFMVAVSLLSGNEPERMLRLLIPPLLVGFAINLTVICAANGMRPGEAVRWFLVAAMINLLWRFGFGVVATGAPLSELRMGILSPAIRFLFAWSACAFLLRHRFTWWSIPILGLPLMIAAISVTRSLALPFVVSFTTAAFCLALAMFWKSYDLRFPFRKLVPLSLMGFTCVFFLAGTMMVMPNLAERWYERVFDNRGEGGATTEDLSTLMRKAEAVSMWEILAEDPHTFLYGKGLGAPYYWDEKYYPELFLVYPDDRHQFPFEIYSAGHSIWTYTLFSSGFLGIALTLSAFFLPMALSLRSAHLTARTVMGPRAWDSFLVFLPFVAMWATLSESITRNPFDERFTGVLLGFLMALPQFFFNRACYLGYRESIGQSAAQSIVGMADEDNHIAPQEDGPVSHAAPPGSPVEKGSVWSAPAPSTTHPDRQPFDTSRPKSNTTRQ